MPKAPSPRQPNEDDAAYVALATPRAGGSNGSTVDADDAWRADMSSPLDRAGWLSTFTLWWINPAIKRGYKTLLEEGDVWDLPKSDQADVLQRRFDKHYADAVRRHDQSQAITKTDAPPSVYRAMWLSTKDKMGVAIVFHFISSAASLLQPLLIKALLQNLQGNDNMFGITSGYWLAALLTVAACVSVNAVDYGMYLTARAGINARMIVVNSVYQKTLRLTSTARLSMNSGDIITLAGVDSDRLFEAYSIGMWAVVGPVVVLAGCIIIGFLTSFFVALAAAVVAACILTFAVTNSRQIGLTRREILKVAGERVKVTNEVLQGIRVIKMYAWEQSISDRIAEIRAREVALLRKYDYMRVYNFVVLTYGPILMMTACFLVYIYEGHKLTVPTAFALISVTNACRQPFSVFSNAVVFSSEGWTALKRIAKFLSADEIKVDKSTLGHEPLVEGQPIIDIQAADFTWLAKPSGDTAVDAQRPTLRNINFQVAPGSLTIIVGAVGSGKSSLISALLGEMEQLRGTRAVRGSVAYASQQAWIQHTTVRENILFGTPYDRAYYDQVIAACQLTRDLEILDDGDATEIGERGINLSGGQKARVSLARTMYRRESDLVVLDDPLSALDVHVANAVFFDCVKGLIASKTRLLVLNAHYHLLPHADRVVVMSKGEIIGDGTFDQVRAKFSFLEDQAHEKALKKETSHAIRPQDDYLEEREAELAEEERSYANGPDAPDAFDTPETMTRNSFSTEASRVSRVSYRNSRAASRVEREESKADVEPKKTMMAAEDRAVGSITWRTYTAFLESTGYNGVGLLVALFFIFCLGQCGLVAADYFVTYWSNGSLDQYSQKSLVWMYVGIAACAVLLGVFRSAFFAEICIKCATVIHAKYFNKVLFAPVNTFFDVTPIGRVLNRFSRDLDQIDNPIPWYTLACLVYVSMVLSVFIICAITTPTTIILYLPLLYAANYVQSYFLNTSRELKRLDGVTRSPFLNLVSETLNGIESIRSFRMKEQFSQKCRDLLDYNSKFFFHFQVANKWFAMRLDWLVTTVVAVVSFTCVASRDSIGAGNVGIALTYSVQLTLQFQRLLTLSSMTENYMTSFERIAHYGTLEEEGATKKNVLAAVPPPPSWPVNGTIHFDNVFLRYRDGLDFVLRGVSFSVHDGEKIGVCGRTGSGKSTLMNALFRTIETAQGVIRIDGVDIASVTLQQLRSRLTIIPQDPVLFSGSLRENLDPFGEKSDEELFSALRKVHLIEDVGRWGQGLTYEVAEKGENLSVGQRQLICIARALLRESRIIVLDEATANVDQELDRLIQVAVRECFVGRTSLTIAHRLETIADSDRILVMEQGRVAEFDAPAALLAKPDGLFASLMKSTATQASTSS